MANEYKYRVRAAVKGKNLCDSWKAKYILLYALCFGSLVRNSVQYVLLLFLELFELFGIFHLFI